MTTAERRAPQRFAGFLCLLLAATVLLALIGWLPTRRLVPEGGVAAMSAGLAVSCIASAIGALPVFFAERRHGSAQLQHTLGSMAATVAGKESTP